MPRGFAGMTKEQRVKIARMGGHAVPNHKRGFAQNRALAAEAGRKGGLKTAAENRYFTRHPDKAKEASDKAHVPVAPTLKDLI